jgi:hypothetical protein
MSNSNNNHDPNHRWSGRKEREIWASYSDKTVRVYQAYNNEIADAALQAQQFVSPSIVRLNNISFYIHTVTDETNNSIRVYYPIHVLVMTFIGTSSVFQQLCIALCDFCCKIVYGQNCKWQGVLAVKKQCNKT